MKRWWLLALPLVLLASCNNTNSSSSSSINSNSFVSTSSNSTSSSSSSSSFVHKTNYGIAPIFDDPLGIYDKDPSIFEENGKRYVFYTTNEKSFESGDVIGLRIGEKDENGYRYSDAKIVLRPSENKWDSVRVSNPDVIKGTFKYEEAEYSYLMAYQGNSKVKDRLYEIGFAVSNDLENWIKVGDKAVINYSSYALGSAYGCGAPSLVSFDKKGKLYCFYTYADALITSTRVAYFDCTDLNDIKSNEPSALSSHGLQDKNADVVFNNADFVIDKEKESIYVVRDRNPVMSMPATSDSIQIAKANLNILTNPFDYQWEIIYSAISDLDTAVLDSDDPNQEFGWERIYSPCFISNPYGELISFKQKVAFSVSAVGNSGDTQYIFTPAIVEYDVELYVEREI